MKVPYYKGKKLTRRFVRKKSGSSKKYKNVGQITVFWLFLKNRSDDFGQNAPECRTNQYGTARENRMSRFWSVLKIFIHKVLILAIKAEVVSKDALYLEKRRCYRKSDLILCIYDKFPFPHVPLDFCLVFVFRVKIWPENSQFVVSFWMVLGAFLVYYLKYIDEIWSEVKQNGKEAVAKDSRLLFATI